MLAVLKDFVVYVEIIIISIWFVRVELGVRNLGILVIWRAKKDGKDEVNKETRKIIDRKIQPNICESKNF